MKRTTVSALVTYSNARPDQARREFAAAAAAIGDLEGDVELAVNSTRVRLSRQQVAIVRELFDAAASGKNFLLYHDDADLAPLIVESLGVAATDSATMSSQTAADILNVSRPFVVKLARTGELPHTKVGNRHRFRAADVRAYAEQMRSNREAALQELVPDDGYTATDF